MAESDAYGFGVSPVKLSFQAVAAAGSTPSTSPGTATSEGTPKTPSSFGDSVIPDVTDSVTPTPKAGNIRLSETAIYHRMRRVFHPSGRGKGKKVSDELVKQWDKGGKSRKSLEQIFQSCGYSPDSGV